MQQTGEPTSAASLSLALKSVPAPTSPTNHTLASSTPRNQNIATHPLVTASAQSKAQSKTGFDHPKAAKHRSQLLSLYAQGFSSELDQPVIANELGPSSSLSAMQSGNTSSVVTLPASQPLPSSEPSQSINAAPFSMLSQPTDTGDHESMFTFSPGEPDTQSLQLLCAQRVSSLALDSTASDAPNLTVL